MSNARNTRSSAIQPDLVNRCASAIVYVAAIVVCLWFGEIPTAVIVAVMSCLSCMEFFQMMRQAGRLPYIQLGLIGSGLFPLATLLHDSYMVIVIFLFIMLLGLWYIFTPRANVLDVSVTVFDALYTGVLFSSIVAIRDAVAGTDGFILTLGVFASTWATILLPILLGTL